MNEGGASRDRAPAAGAAVERALAEALEQQAATSEILQVIARSRGDAQPVFDTIARSAARLCSATFCHVFRFEGGLLHFDASHGLSREAFELGRKLYPMAPGRGSAAARAVLSRRVEQIPDIEADREYAHGAFSAVVRQKSIVAVPMLLHGEPIGAIAVARAEPGLVPERQLELLRTFADQAVIAVENARLFREIEGRNRDLSESLEQQTATSEILRVISRSPTDVQPVFETIVAAALKLCNASAATFATYDGEKLALVATANVKSPAGADALRRSFPRPLSGDTAVGRAVLTRGVVEIDDVWQDADYRIQEAATKSGFRSVIGVPLMRRGEPIGAFAVGRDWTGPFPARQVELLETFAEQAVIAVENVRLFNELEHRNRDLAESLEQQTATSDILRVISRSPTDVQPVYDTIAQSAARLCNAAFCHVFRYDGKLLHVTANHGLPPTLTKLGRSLYPMAPGRGSAAARAVLNGRVEEIPDIDADREYAHGAFAEAVKQRSIVAVPMMLGGAPIGAIAIGRRETGHLPPRQLELLKTFAEQAVIAIENARLFHELQDRNRDVTEALEQKTATAEILQVISAARTDAQPVFDMIVRNAARLCGGMFANVIGYDGELMHFVATSNPSPELAQIVGRRYPMRADHTQAAGRAILRKAAVVIEDAFADPDYPRDIAVAGGWRRMLGVPMLRDAAPLGAILVGWAEPGPVPKIYEELLRTFADQAVIAIENVRLFDELERRNRDVTEALEHQTATAEILRVISRSPGDVQPVFEVIGERAARLCEARVSVVSRVAGDRIEAVAIGGVAPDAVAKVRAQFPMTRDTQSATARAVRKRAVEHIPDVFADPDYGTKDAAAAADWRGCAAVPMLRGDEVIGAIFVARAEAGLFPPSKIELLKTFADQAVIAIENVRLFNETREALDRQLATGDVLKVISRSAFDLEPVLASVLESATRLCGAQHAHVMRYDGECLRLAASHGGDPAMADHIRARPLPLDRTSIAGTAALERRPVHWRDVLEVEGYSQLAAQRLGGFRTLLAVPMVKDDALLGVIVLWKSRVEPFTDKQIELVATFADQAAIAIENVRLFNETKEALERQTGTANVLRAISRTAFDLAPVLDMLIENATRMCKAENGHVFLRDGDAYRLTASHGASRAFVEYMRDRTVGADRGTAVGRAVLTRLPVQIPDVKLDADYTWHEAPELLGFRGILAVPMLREREPIGAICVWRQAPGPFAQRDVDLVASFADQAVIAIENVRLLSELRDRTAALDRSVQELRALGEVGQAVASSLDLETVLRTIVTRATELTGTSGGSIWEYDEAHELFHMHATHRQDDEVANALRATPIRKGEGVIGKLALNGEPVVVRDIREEGAYQSRVRDVLVRHGFRAILAVPLLHDRRLLGGLTVNRDTPGDFSPEVVALMKTFATQSALAIQNARLFRELEHKGRELESASRHKSEFLANMSHELRTPLNAILGFSELLSERIFGEINEKQAEYLKDIQESGRHLLALINDILDLSKIEAGRMELELSEFDLPSAIGNTLILVRERAERRGVALGSAIDASLGAFRADERKLKQVLLNLLSNALKFTPEGGRVDVAARARDGGAEISVTDTGVGIAPEDQDAVFEEFRQVGAAARKVEGTGLGLAISRKFVELHGGRLRVESTIGKGSTFTFTLPSQPPPGARAETL